MHIKREIFSHPETCMCSIPIMASLFPPNEPLPLLLQEGQRKKGHKTIKKQEVITQMCIPSHVVSPSSLFICLLNFFKSIAVGIHF